jgi:transcriptional regulator with XRE-family HTH domain
MMTEKETGEVLRAKRGTRSLREVATAAGITPRQVQDIEQARTAYTYRSLLALAAAVGAKHKWQ